MIYGQRTADGRFAFGGRGAPYHFGSRVDAVRQEPARVRALHRRCGRCSRPRRRAVTHRWGGAVAIPRDWYSSVVFDQATACCGRAATSVTAWRPAISPAARSPTSSCRDTDSPAAVGRAPLAALGAGAAAVPRDQGRPGSPATSLDRAEAAGRNPRRREEAAREVCSAADRRARSGGSVERRNRRQSPCRATPPCARGPARVLRSARVGTRYVLGANRVQDERGDLIGCRYRRW